MIGRTARATADALIISRASPPSSMWDRFVASQRDATFCHLAGWSTIMEDVLGHESFGLVAADADGEWQGVLPLVHVRSRLFGRYLLSMPFLNYGGPIGSEAARHALSLASVDLARDLRVQLLELRARTATLPDLARSDRKITVLLELGSDAETLFGKLPSKLRSQIRRPVKEGMQTRFGADEAESFYRVFARNMRDLGTPVLPRAFFERVAAAFPGVADFGVVYHAGQPVAAGCGFHYGGEFEITWASSLKDFNRLAPNMLLYWKLMERAIERGARVFNFGRCTSGSGTHNFKRQWGGVDEPLPWAQWSSARIAQTPSPDRPIFQLATACWRRLPIVVTNALGPMLARSLP